jgi:LmbE family N-acetylglucosaminyl deacetylase/glycosyltransferase involved in cell wall biosynthesis
MRSESELIPYHSTDLTGRRVLVFAPHPDDETIGCGGALALHRQAGDPVKVIILTNGAQGDMTGAWDRDAYIALRQTETREACMLLGIDDIDFWGYEDRKLDSSPGAVERAADLLKVYRPEIVYCPSPLEFHPDHRAACLLAYHALRECGIDFDLAFYEINQPIMVNTLVDITPVVHLKRDAIAAYKSQLKERPYDDICLALSRFRSMTLPQGATHAEGFSISSAGLIWESNLFEPLFEPLERLKGEFQHPDQKMLSLNCHFLSADMETRNAIEETSERSSQDPSQGQEPPLHPRKIDTEGHLEDPPPVSIIVRSMDRLTLDEALASIKLQTYPHIEVVVVNARGGVHREIEEQCGRFPLRLLNQDGPPLPRSKAANLGLSACRGGYIGLLDDDDAILSQHVKGLMDVLLQEAGNHMVAYAGAQGLSRAEGPNRVLKVFAESEVTFSKLVLGNVLPIHSVLFPAALLKNGIRFDEALDCYEDWDFWLQLARIARFQFVDQMTAIYYLGGESDVSPMQPEEKAVLEAKHTLFAKWLHLLTPEEVGDIAHLHHQTVYDIASRCDYLKKELNQYRSSLQESQCALQENRMQLQDALRRAQEAELQKLQAQKIHAEEVAHLQSHLANIFNSWSWRATRPLRWVAMVARNSRAGLLQTLKHFYSRLPLTLDQRAAVRSFYYRRRPLSKHKGGMPIKPSNPFSPCTAGAMETAPFKILLIERWVPRPNQDAGSVMIYHFMQVLRRMGHAVSFLPFDLAYDPEYTPELQKLGVQCLHGPDIKSIEGHLSAAENAYDVIIACRPDHIEALLPLFKIYCPKARLLYETHDLHFVREQRQAEIEQNGDLLRHSKWRKSQELRIAAASDCTLVVSRHEQEILLRENPDLYVEVIPVIEEVHGCKTGYDQRTDLVFIGGYEHRPNVDAVVYFVKEILPLIMERLPDIRFLIVGSHPPQEILSLASQNAIIQGFVPDITELMNHVRISVNPIRFGAGVKGKILTSMSYGAPCVGTTVAMEGMDIVPGVHALVGDDPRSFADAVIQLHSDRQLWERISVEGLTFVQKHFSLEVAEGAFGRIFDRLLQPADPPSLQLTRANSYESYVRQRSEQELKRREAIEKAYVSRNADSIETRGFCFVCDREMVFSTDLSYGFPAPDGGMAPNWRERVVCPSCRLNNRMRGAIHLFHLLCHPMPQSRLYLTEQTTHLFKWFEDAYPDITGSEYLGDDAGPGEINSDGIRNEDLTALTFPDNGFNAILSFDVFEHIPNYRKALQECWRCLRPGGSLFFTVPFDLNARENVVRAELDSEGQVHHLLPPEYHGDPLHPGGCLCYYHFGWRLLDELRDMGFRDASAYLYWSEYFGYLGGEQLVLRAEK